MLRQTPRAFVEQLDFKTSRGDRVRVVVTDLGVLEPRDGELTLVRVHPGRERRRRPRRDRLGARASPTTSASPSRRRDAELDGAARAGDEKGRDVRRRLSASSSPTTRASGRRCRSTIRATARRACARADAAARHAARGAPRSRRARCSARTRSSELDDDLTRQHDGEPLGERIIVTGRVLDEDGAADPRRARRGLAGERGRPLPPRGRPASGAARPELLRRRPLPHRRRRPLPLRHDQARRVSVGEPRERVAAGAHPLLGLRPRVHAAARHADVLPRRPAVRVRPDLPLGARPEGARAADRALRPRRRRSRSGRSATGGTSSSAAAAPARPRWRTSRDAAAHAVADGRPVLRDRPLRAGPQNELVRRGRPGRGPAERAAARRRGRADRRRDDRGLGRRSGSRWGRERHRRRRPLLVRRREAGRAAGRARRGSTSSSSRAACSGTS